MHDGVIRVGVVGVGRGSMFARGAAERIGMKLVALCDLWEERLQVLGKELGVAVYTDFGRFLKHDLDAVILANYFHQHAPLAIAALHAGKHVMSETSACFTLAEGVALIRAVERSKRTYMLAENYPYMIMNQEMRRVYASGEIGEFRYGEGEYVHPMSPEFANAIAPGVTHWRNWLPITYYNTHALAPIMFVTETWPVKVNGFVVPYDPDDPARTRTARVQDTASMIAVRMDNGAVVKLLQGNLRGHSIFYRIHGNRGLIESLRHGNTGHVRLHKEPWDTQDGETVEKVYAPTLPPEAPEAAGSGHGGGDFFMDYHFADAIRSGTPPFLDVYRGVAMSVVGIQAYRSALADSAMVVIPDFRREEVRQAYENDHWSPDPDHWHEGQPLPSILGRIEPTPEGLAYAREVWAKEGYTE